MPIPRDPFAAALAKGSGRAMILLKRSADIDALKADLFEACLHNQAYDRQCEHERSRYLLGLIEATGDMLGFFSALTPRLADHDAEDRDILHRFRLLVRMATESPGLDARVLSLAYKAFSRARQWACMEEMVLLEGLPALIQSAEWLKGLLAEEGWRAEGLLEALQEREGAAALDMARAAAAENPALALLINGAEDTPEPEKPKQTAIDFQSIRRALAIGERPAGSWLTLLDVAEMQALAGDLAASTDDAARIAYLRVFLMRPFTGDPSIFMDLAESSIPRVSWLAVRALGQMKHPAVRALAINKLRENDPVGLRLLSSSYKPGDLALVTPLLEDCDDDDRKHELGISLPKLLSANAVPAETGAPILVCLYDFTPCSFCRQQIVETLAASAMAPAWMIEECQYDADPDTVRLFHASSD